MLLGSETELAIHNSWHLVMFEQTHDGISSLTEKL